MNIQSLGREGPMTKGEQSTGEAKVPNIFYNNSSCMVEKFVQSACSYAETYCHVI